MSVIGPNDGPRLTPKQLAEAKEYTERFNREILGLKPPTKAQQAKDERTLQAILDLIGFPSETE